MKRIAPLVAFALTLLAAQTGCSAGPGLPMAPSAPSDVARASSPMPPPPPGAPEPAAAPAPAPGGPKGGLTLPASDKGGAPRPADARGAKSAGPAQHAPLIIYQGELRMMADEEAIPKTIDRIIDAAESVGGHLAGRKDQSVQVKVPSGGFRDALAKIEAIGGVVSRSVTADDVSEECHDLEVRLANLRATRQRLQEFLAKAGNVQDLLTVERELERVAQEIDRAEGRLEFLRARAAMSLISVHLGAKPKVAPVVVATKPTPPAPRAANLPIPWVAQVGIDPLLSLKK
ncbi:MAG TPA: DUF4349 domain-containing protein [Polyangiaceae bacterium]|nr:DUF4349 domain-containing protein [Polyangiaceae bacterium]